MSATRYLLGVLELMLEGGAAVVVAVWLRRRLLPGWRGAAATLAAAVLALAVLVWAAVLLGTAGLLEPVPYLAFLAVAAIGAVALGRRGPAGGPPGEVAAGDAGEEPRRRAGLAAAVALAIAAVALAHFAAGARARLGTGMTGFDSTWYHGPFAAGFFQSGDTWSLHLIAPQFLAWFYPANGEIFHAIGMLAFGRDILSPLLNLGWFAGCLAAAWCIGRPYRVAPASLALAAAALSIPALADQAGEARNDLAATFFLLAAVALSLSAARRPPDRDGVSWTSGRLAPAALAVCAVAAGLAAGTKLNFLLPVAVLVLGLVAMAPRGARIRAAAVACGAALAGGGYWYLRNLAHTGNPLPWFGGVGPLHLPAPGQALGGREGHSVLGYLTDGSVWSNWFLPGLHEGLGLLWPVVLGAASLGLLLALSRRADGPLRLAGLVGLAAIAAWAVAPTSASGPEGIPRGFVSGLRYLAPALVLGMAVLPAVPRLRGPVAAACARPVGPSWAPARRAAAGVALALLMAAVAAGYLVQRHYLDSRYANPEFADPGLNAAFKWAQSIAGARIATTTTRQYPLFGADLSNRVQFVGIERPHGGFVAPQSCRAWRRALAAGHYDYVVASRDRIEKGKPAYPAAARWTEGPGAKVILRVPPTVVFKLTAPLPPSGCRAATPRPGGRG